MLTLAIVLLFAYGSYQTVVACLVKTPDDIVKSLTPKVGDVRGLAQGLVGQLESFVQNSRKEALEHSIRTATGAFLAGYQAAAVEALRQPPDLYGWAFVVLVALPVVGIVVVVARNFDAISQAVSPPASAMTGAAAGVYPAAVPAPARGGGAGSAAPGDAVDKLAKLKSLLDAGFISREEFDTQKGVILGGSPAKVEPEELRKLRALWEAGALTQEEYETTRRRILANL